MILSTENFSNLKPVITADLATAQTSRPDRCSARWVNFAAGATVGIAAYIALGFHHTLPPGNIDWLLGYSAQYPFYDPATSFIGWHYFRNSPWTFPPGLNLSYGMEYAGSIALSDSIPLLAFSFKSIRLLLGNNFQYCGIWILICFILQGVFGTLLASLFTRGLLQKGIIAGFFVMSPIMLERGWTEHPLMGHWLILWSLYLYVGDNDRGIRWVWMIVAALVVNITFYFVPMVLLIWGADLFRRAFQRIRNVPWLLLEAIGVGAITVLAMWITGYFFLSWHDAVTDDFGRFATNLIGPIDPWGWSLFLQPQPKPPQWLGEGFSYLGLGMLLLCVMALFEFIRQPVPGRALLRIAPLALVMAGLAAFSLSNRVSLGSHVLHLPNIYFRFGPIFRASGRMFWPAYYGLWLGAFYIVIRRLKPGPATAILAAMLGIQILDLMPSHRAMRQRNENPPAWRFTLNDPFWDAAGSRYRHIEIVPSGAALPFVSLAYWGANHGLSTNNAYLARHPDILMMRKFTAQRESALNDNHPDPQTLYIIPDSSRFALFKAKLGKEHGLGKIDGYRVIAPFWFADGHPAASGALAPGDR